MLYNLINKINRRKNMSRESLIEILALNCNHEYLWEAKQSACKLRLTTAYNKHLGVGKTTKHRETSKEVLHGKAKSINCLLDLVLKSKSAFRKFEGYMDVPCYEPEDVDKAISHIKSQYKIKAWKYKGQVFIKI